MVQKKSKNAIITFRKAKIEDLPKIQEVFLEAIRKTCSKDYSPEQLEAWMSSVQNRNKWLLKIKKQYFLLAIYGREIVGFGSLDSFKTIDLLYVHPEQQNKNIASMLLEELERAAIQNKQQNLDVQASITASEFFTRRAYKKVKGNSKKIKDQILFNFIMTKKI